MKKRSMQELEYKIQEVTFDLRQVYDSYHNGEMTKTELYTALNPRYDKYIKVTKQKIELIKGRTAS